MAEFVLDDDSVSRAAALSSRLLDDLRLVGEKVPASKVRRELFSEQRYSKQSEGVPIGDVVANVSQMASEFAAARRWNGEVPCLKLDNGEPAPITMSQFFGDPLWRSSGSEDWIEWWGRRVPFPLPHPVWRDALRASDREERFVVIDVSEAEGLVQRGLGSFLSYRFAGMKRWAEWIQGVGSTFFGSAARQPSTRSGTTPPPPAVAPGGGLQVQVSCLTPGLRIHVSPAYFINWLFFGSPTTPVTSYVLPGRYIFAGDGPMLPRLTRDHGVFNIPPTYHPALTRF